MDEVKGRETRCSGRALHKSLTGSYACPFRHLQRCQEMVMLFLAMQLSCRELDAYAWSSQMPSEKETERVVRCWRYFLPIFKASIIHMKHFTSSTPAHPVSKAIKSTHLGVIYQCEGPSRMKYPSRSAHGGPEPDHKRCYEEPGV